jgi:hypothetical protein
MSETALQAKKNDATEEAACFPSEKEKPKTFFSYLELQRASLGVVLDRIGQILHGEGVRFF